MLFAHAQDGNRLNTFLELKMENQRLQYRIQELRAQQAQFASTSTAPTLTTTTLPPTISSLPVQLPIDSPSPTVPDHSELAATNPGPITRNLEAAGFQEGDQGEPAKKKVRCIRHSDAVEMITQCHIFQTKKQTPLISQRVCVTCGRTDSPEWRKVRPRPESLLSSYLKDFFAQGPLGPKTLCNACGLRWAKQARKLDDTSEGGGANTFV